MKTDLTVLPRRFVRWLCGSPFRELPPAYGSPVPADLQVFEAQNSEAYWLTRGARRRHTNAMRQPHRRTRPARLCDWMERQ